MTFLDRLLGRTAPPLAKPAINLLLRGGNIFMTTRDNEPVTGIALLTRVWNSGAPVAIVRWRLEVIPNGVAFACDSAEIPNVLTLNGPMSTVINGADSLENRIGTRKIGDDLFEGQLLFYSELPHAAVMAPTTRLKLIATDTYGTDYTTDQLMGAWPKGKS